jgi:preprotein translocase subunit YajC
VLALVWVLFIMPQRRRQAAQRRMLEEIQVGDEIVTVGGLLGHVRGIDEDDEELVLEIAPGTNVRLALRAVAAVVPPKTAHDEAVDEPDEEAVDEPADEAVESGSDPVEAKPR